eukprot:SAG25_NODE_11827_length_294_cov_0.789744_1_plen_22_part_01
MPDEDGAASVASLLAAVLAEIY